MHAIVAADASVPGLLAATVAAVPPLVLLASTHLTVVLTRSTTRPLSTAHAPQKAAVETETESEPELEAVAGRRERAARLREAGWSNKAIADELQVHPSTVGRWFTSPLDEPEITTREMETTS